LPLGAQWNKHITVMRRLIATILAICLGILLPAAAMPVRVCLLDPAERSENCCGSCTTEHQDCCADLETLPDAPMPGGNFETPGFVGYASPAVSVVLPRIPERIAPAPCFALARKGIGPPAGRLAVLNVWRL
jgi:hypothetical protein